MGASLHASDLVSGLRFAPNGLRSESHRGAGQGSGDPLDRLDLLDDELPGRIDALGDVYPAIVDLGRQDGRDRVVAFARPSPCAAFALAVEANAAHGEGRANAT